MDLSTAIALVSIILTIVGFFLPREWWSKKWAKLFFSEELKLIELIKFEMNAPNLLNIPFATSNRKIGTTTRTSIITENIFIFFDVDLENEVTFIQIISRNKRLHPLFYETFFSKALGQQTFHEHCPEVAGIRHTEKSTNWRHFYYAEEYSGGKLSGYIPYHIAYYQEGCTYGKTKNPISYATKNDEFRTLAIPNSYAIGNPARDDETHEYHLIETWEVRKLTKTSN